MTILPAAANDLAPPAPAADDPALLAAAARVLRRRGPAATLKEIAVEAGVSESALRSLHPTCGALAQAVFAEVHRRLHSEHAKPWKGYGGGFRRSLAAARSFSDGYLLLARDASLHPAWRPAHEALLRRMGKRVRSILWYPEPAPPADALPPHLERVAAPMVAFAVESIAGWLETGEPARDDLMVRWYGQMMRDWRHNTAEFLDLDTPEQDWPFAEDSDLP